jgi:transcriptional antiterminator RfaH
MSAIRIQDAMPPHGSPSWYVIHTKIRQEDRANQNLRAWGVETLLPRRRGRTRSAAGVPLFARYLFARFDPVSMLQKVRFTRGVHRVVSFDQELAMVPEPIIDLIRARMDAGGLVALGEPWKAGDRLLIRRGPMKDFVAVFDDALNNDDRVAVLLTAVRGHIRVIVARDALAPLAS